MKIKLFYIGVFILALLTGYFTVIPFLSRPVTSNVGDAIRQTDFPDLQTKARAEPEIFDVDDFFDEWPDKGIEMLETGEGVRLEEVAFKSGDKLLGLYYEDSKGLLKSSTVKIKNDKEGWKNISVDNKIKPRFLLKPSGTFREGSVVTLFSGFSSDDLENDDPGNETTEFEDIRDRRFDLGGTTYSFDIKKGLSKEGKNVVVLLLGDGENTQIINIWFYGSDEPYLWDNLLWVGDIDHDNKLDFYMEFFNEKGSYSTGLFLSSKAEKGELVKLVGGFSTLGC